ncbi:MAG: hypothetical protein QXO76_05300 [Thermoproteota archaeon]
MSKHISLILALALLSTFLSTSLNSYASPFELSYDDGKAEYGWSDFHPYAAAVRFTSPSESWRITGIRLHATCLLRDPASLFYVQIWDSGLNTKYWSAFMFGKVFSNNTLDWYTIQLQNVVVTGVFYVVIVPMFTLDGAQLWISVDSDPSFSNNSFIVNVGEHIILASLNATSKRPGDFMIRVVGEPTPTPPELRLYSVNVNEDEAILTFKYPGELAGFEAKLVKNDGSFTEENVTRLGENLVVRVRGEGLLTVNLLTPSHETIGASVRLETGLRSLYESLLANYTALKRNADDMAGQIGLLAKVNEELRLSLNQSQALVRLQNDRIEELLSNVSTLREELDKARVEASSLRGLNTLLTIGLIVAVTVSFLLGFPGVRRRWRREK